MRLVDPPSEVHEDVGALPPLGHLRCLLTPGACCLYLALAPGGWEWALAFAALPFLLDLLASRSAEERRQPSTSAHARALSLLVYALFALQWANLALAASLFARIEPISAQGATALLLLSLSSSLAAGAGGHELIHRPGRAYQAAGRLLLGTIFYEHLFTEHLRGHHARAGTPADPTSARLGESLVAYLRRAIPGQYASAWRLERERLQARAWPQRLLGHRVLQGIAIEVGLVALWGGLFGWAGLSVFVIQGVVANLLFQVTNYFQHWGTTRDMADPAAVSWDTVNKSTLFSMIGLARHGDHHLNPRRPFQELRYQEASNQLPGSYGRMIWLAVFRNRRFQELLTAELRRRGRLSG